MRIVIEGRQLPGRRFCDATNVHVVLQVGREPFGPVPADSSSARWEIDVRRVDGDFRGPAVHGKRHERHLYVTWGDVDSGGGFSMFRRAKLMLDPLPERLLADAERPGHALVATVDLTDQRGGPRCARVDPPAVRWSVSPLEG